MSNVKDAGTYNDSLYQVLSNNSSISSISSDISSGSSDEDQNSDYADDVSELTQAELTSQISNISTLSQDRRNRIERSVTHYENMDKGITRMPQFCKADEFLKCLSQFTMENETLKDLGQLKNDTDPNSKNVKYEIIIENQRGATLFGSKMFSKQSVLYPLDPPKYQTLTGQNLVNLSMYPEPAHNWMWCWKKWHVMMINDVDEEGWIYSPIRFGSYKWTGVGKFGNFVRRRIWVRMVERLNYEGLTDDETTSDSENGSESDGKETEEEKERKHEILHVLPTFKDIGSRNNNEIDILSEKVKQNLLQNLNSHTKIFPKNTKLKTNNKHIQSKDNEMSRHNSLASTQSSSHTSDSYSDDTQSIVSFSRDTIAETNLSPQPTLIYSNSSMASLNEMSDDEKILQDTLNHVKDCAIDRQRISAILDSFFSYQGCTIDYLLDNYQKSKNKSKSWLNKLLSQLHFHESDIIFIQKFKILLNTSDESPERKEQLFKLYLISKEQVDKRSYDSER